MQSWQRAKKTSVVETRESVSVSGAEVVGRTRWSGLMSSSSVVGKGRFGATVRDVLDFGFWVSRRTCTELNSSHGGLSKGSLPAGRRASNHLTGERAATKTVSFRGSPRVSGSRSEGGPGVELLFGVARGDDEGAETAIMSRFPMTGSVWRREKGSGVGGTGSGKVQLVLKGKGKRRTGPSAN